MLALVASIHVSGPALAALKPRIGRAWPDHDDVGARTPLATAYDPLKHTILSLGLLPTSTGMSSVLLIA